MIDVIDYGGGNMGSLLRALGRLEIEYRRITDVSDLSDGNPMIVPGVASFGAAMNNLDRGGFTDAIQERVHRGIPYLGICAGMQILMESSEESPGVKGLGLVSGQVLRFQAAKVPQVGWNMIKPQQDVPHSGHVYFVNSYYVQPQDPSVSFFFAEYAGPFCAAIKTGNITAFQFHPEKSGELGQRLLGDWVKAHA